MTGRDAALGETDVLPLVGIGMPVYNGMRYVAEAIDSILRQSYESFELVICDNASTDGTADLCRKFAASDPRIRYFRNDTNIGAHPNYNRTFELTRGKYFKWAPHDDVLHRDFLSACVEALDADPGIVICQTLLDYIDDQGRKLGIVSTALAGTESDSAVERFAAATLLPHNCYSVMGLFRRDALVGSMLLQSFHGADRALIAQLALRGRFLEIPRALLQVRDHAERYTRAQVRPGSRRVARHAPQGQANVSNVALVPGILVDDVSRESDSGRANANVRATPAVVVRELESRSHGDRSACSFFPRNDGLVRALETKGIFACTGNRPGPEAALTPLCARLLHRSHVFCNCE